MLIFLSLSQLVICFCYHVDQLQLQPKYLSCFALVDLAQHQETWPVFTKETGIHLQLPYFQNLLPIIFEEATFVSDFVRPFENPIYHFYAIC